jgi:hypothetical protein
LACFDTGANLESAAPVRQGFQTGDNDYFMRWWHEVDFTKVMLNASSKEDVFDAGKKWVPYNKGGEFRKWYGNNEYLVAFDREHYEMLLVSGNCLPSRHLYFRESVTWSAMGGRAIAPSWVIWHDWASVFRRLLWNSEGLGRRLFQETMSCRAPSLLGCKIISLNSPILADVR